MSTKANVPTDPETIAAFKAGIDAIRAVVARFTDKQLKGIYVWVNEDLGLAIIDCMDWYERSKDGTDPAKEIGAIAAKQWGKERVIYQNEGASPPKSKDWVNLMDRESAHAAFGNKPTDQQEWQRLNGQIVDALLLGHEPDAAAVDARNALSEKLGYVEETGVGDID